MIGRVKYLRSLRHQISSFNKWRRLVGLRSSLHRLFIRASQIVGVAEPELWHVHPRQVLHVLTVRLRGSSDMDVFDQIFFCDEYASLRSLESVSLVLDLGAYVGYSSAYFLSCFQNTRVVAVEPDKRNLEVCKVNLKPYGDRVLLLHGAVWSESTALCLSKGRREWATKVMLPPANSDGNLQAWDMDRLLIMAGAEQVDLLKVDIERSELVVFGETAGHWLHRVRNICIELHGQDCRETFFNSLAGFNYELEYSGELTICKNIRTRAAG